MLAADALDKSVAGARSGSPVNEEETKIELKPGQILSLLAATSNLDTSGNTEVYSDRRARDNGMTNCFYLFT